MTFKAVETALFSPTLTVILQAMKMMIIKVKATLKAMAHGETIQRK